MPQPRRSSVTPEYAAHFAHADDGEIHGAFAALRDQLDQLGGQLRRADAERDRLAAELQTVGERMTWLAETHIG